MNRNKRRRKSKYNNSGISEAGVRTFFIRAIAVWLFILPLIVHIKEVPVPVQMQDLYLTEKAVDLFAYYKAVWLWWGAGIFFVSALILDRYEGTLSWLSYCMAAYAVHSFAASKEHNITLIKGIVLSAGVVGLIGAFQFFKMDFFKTEFGKMLMLGKYYATMSSNLNFTMPEGTSYTTLYNPNYVGSFVAVTLPLVFYMIRQATNNIWRAIYGVIGISLVISLIGSKSTAGLVAVVIVVLIYAVLLASKIKANKAVKIGVPIALVVVILVGLSLPFTQRQVNKIKTLFTEDPNPNHFKSVVVDGKDVIITTDTDQSFTISPKDDLIEVRDEEGNVLKGWEASDHYIVRFPMSSSKNYIMLNFKNHFVDCVYYNQGDYFSIIRFDYFPQFGEFTVLKRVLSSFQHPEVIRLITNEQVLSNRGYIWNRAVPRIISKPILGYGADVFAIVFPQVDLLDKRNAMGDHHIIIDKVHNTYFQLLINFGLIGLTSLFFSIFLGMPKIRLEVKLAIFSFLVVGLINDSITAVTAILFILIMLRRNETVA